MARRLATRIDVAGPSGGPASGVAPELNGVSDGLFTVWLGIAAGKVSTRRFLDETSQAHALLPAHFMTAADVAELGTGEQGPIVSASDGPASVSYAAPPVPEMTDANLSTTVYGRTYLELRKTARGRGSGVIARRGWRSG